MEPEKIDYYSVEKDTLPREKIDGFHFDDETQTYFSVTCPSCFSDNIMPIIYKNQLKTSKNLALKNKIQYYDIYPRIGSPSSKCKDCGNEFGKVAKYKEHKTSKKILLFGIISLSAILFMILLIIINLVW